MRKKCLTIISIVYQALTNCVAYVMYSKLEILQIAILDYFLTSILSNTLFQFPEYVKQPYQIRHTCTLKQSVCQIVKTNNVTCFSFYVFCPLSYDMILNLVIVSKINLQWSCLLILSYTPLQTIQVGNSFDRKTKIKILNILILKICGFVFVKINLIL